MESIGAAALVSTVLFALAANISWELSRGERHDRVRELGRAA